jgi:hypothetical protein
MVVVPLETSTFKSADLLLVKSKTRPQILLKLTGTMITSQFRAAALQLHLAQSNMLYSELLLSLMSSLSPASLKLELELKTLLDSANGLDLTREILLSASGEYPSRLKLSRLINREAKDALLVALMISRSLGCLSLLMSRLEVRMFSHTKSSGTRVILPRPLTTWSNTLRPQLRLALTVKRKVKVIS